MPLSVLPFVVGTLGEQSGSGGARSAWASPLQVLNDRRELVYGLQLFLDQATEMGLPAWAGALNQVLQDPWPPDSDLYQISFSTQLDNLSLWRAYADNGYGCCLVMNPGDIESVARASGRVIYNREIQLEKARRILDKLSTEADPGWGLKVIAIQSAFFKDKGFEHEQEYRFIFEPSPAKIRFRSAGRRIAPYYDFLEGRPAIPIRRLVLGPSWQLMFQSDRLLAHPTVIGVHRLLQSHRIDPQVVDYSRIGYDPA